MSEDMGTLFGIGVGPGDPELITVKGRRILGSAPVVFVPVSDRSARSFAATIAEGLVCRDRQEVVMLPYPMTRDPARNATAWQTNAQRILERLRAGEDAAFLTDGDAMLYSTFAYTMQALRALCPEARIEVVPGVASFSAAAATTLTPLALRDERIAVLPAIYAREELERVLRSFDTVILMKVSGAMDTALDALEAAGRLQDAVFVERCGRPEEAVIDNVATLRGRACDYFSLMIVRRAQ